MNPFGTGNRGTGWLRAILRNAGIGGRDTVSGRAAGIRGLKGGVCPESGAQEGKSDCKGLGEMSRAVAEVLVFWGNYIVLCSLSQLRCALVSSLISLPVGVRMSLSCCCPFSPALSVGMSFRKHYSLIGIMGTLKRPRNINPGSVLPAANLPSRILAPQMLRCQLQRNSFVGKSQLTGVFSTSIAWEDRSAASRSAAQLRPLQSLR